MILDKEDDNLTELYWSLYWHQRWAKMIQIKLSVIF